MRCGCRRGRPQKAPKSHPRWRRKAASTGHQGNTPRTQAEAWATNPRTQVQHRHLEHPARLQSVKKMDGLAVCGGLFWGRFFWGGFVADAADYGLNQVIDALFFGGIHYAKAKLGFIFGAFAGADRKGAT
jgi:hypothetical protein